MSEFMTQEEAQNILTKFDELTREKEALRNQLEEIKEKEEFEISKSSTYGVRKTFFRRLPIGWLNSVYCTKRESLMPFITSTLSAYDLERITDYCNPNNPDKFQIVDHQYFALLCEMVMPTPEGVVLILRDPYKRVTTQPLDKIEQSTALDWIGHILIVKAKIYPEQETTSMLEVLRIKKLKLTRSGIRDIDGTEKNISSYLANELAFRNKVMTHEDCMIEIGRIKKVAKQNGWFVYGSLRNNAVATLVKDSYICGVFSKSDIIEVLWKDNQVISDIDRGIMQCKVNGNENFVPSVNLNEFSMLYDDIKCMCAEPEISDV